MNIEKELKIEIISATTMNYKEKEYLIIGGVKKIAVFEIFQNCLNFILEIPSNISYALKSFQNLLFKINKQRNLEILVLHSSIEDKSNIFLTRVVETTIQFEIESDLKNTFDVFMKNENVNLFGISSECNSESLNYLIYDYSTLQEIAVQNSHLNSSETLNSVESLLSLNYNFKEGGRILSVKNSKIENSLLMISSKGKINIIELISSNNSVEPKYYDNFSIPTEQEFVFAQQGSYPGLYYLAEIGGRFLIYNVDSRSILSSFEVGLTVNSLLESVENDRLFLFLSSSRSNIVKKVVLSLKDQEHIESLSCVEKIFLTKEIDFEKKLREFKDQVSLDYDRAFKKYENLVIEFR